MSEQLQQPSHGRELTVSEISAAGAPNYRGRAIHPQVQFDNKGLMYIGPIPSNTNNKRTASLPVKLVALGEQGHQQCTVRASDDDDHLELVVTSDPDLLRIDRRSRNSGGTRTPWLTVPAKNLSYVKVAVNRWQDGNEGSDVLIAALFKAEDRPKPLVLLLEVDTRHHHNISVVQLDKTPRRLDTSFDPNALEHIKAFFLSWQQKDYCRTEIDPTRALAVPPPGQSLSSRPPVPEGYDPHDSTTWIAPFGPVSGDQEALYLDDAAWKEATTKAAGKGKSKAKGQDKVAMAAVTRVEASPGPRPEASTHASSAQSVVVGPMDDEPTVVITQSGRTVKSLRRDGFTSSVDTQSEEDHNDDDDDDDAASKGTRATRTTTARGKAKAKAKAQVGLTAPATAGAGPEVSSSARRNAASPTAKSVTPEETPPAAVVLTQQGGRNVRTRTTVHFPSSFDMESNADDDDAEEEDAARKALVSAAATTDPRRKSKPRAKIKDKVAAIASSSGAQSVGPAVETPPAPPPPPVAPVVITQSGRTVKTRLIHSLPSDTDDDDDEEDDEDGAEAADDFSPPPPRRGSSSSSKKKKPPAKRPRVGRKRSESVVAETTGGGGGATIQGGRVDGTENGEQRAQKMEVDREEEQVIQGGEVAGAATADSGGSTADQQEQQQQQGEVVAKEAGPWLDRLPFALPPLPLSATTATGAAGYRQRLLEQQQQQQQQLDDAPTSLVDLDLSSTTMTTRSSPRRPGSVPNAEAGASTALR